ncbi:MAG: hypothetical protein IIW48_10515 [Clostridia bacterium]|nr:hypothetical protein [Clostridia bacterium]
MYRAVEQFADLQDDKYIYEIGMIYPRKGHNPSDERIKELASSENKVGRPVIEFFADPDPVKQEESRPKREKKQKK